MSHSFNALSRFVSRHNPRPGQLREWREATEKLNASLERAREHDARAKAWADEIVRIEA